MIANLYQIQWQLIAYVVRNIQKKYTRIENFLFLNLKVNFFFQHYLKSFYLYPVVDCKAFLYAMSVM